MSVCAASIWVCVLLAVLSGDVCLLCTGSQGEEGAASPHDTSANMVAAAYTLIWKQHTHPYGSSTHTHMEAAHTLIWKQHTHPYGSSTHTLIWKQHTHSDARDTHT